MVSILFHLSTKHQAQVVEGTLGGPGHWKCSRMDTTSVFLFAHYGWVTIFGVQMTSCCTSIRVGQAQTRLEPWTHLVSQRELPTSTAIASRSLSAGYGCMNNLNVTQHLLLVLALFLRLAPSLSLMHPSAPDTAEERIRKELKWDRKDWVRDFSLWRCRSITRSGWTHNRYSSFLRVTRTHIPASSISRCYRCLPSSVPYEHMFLSSKETYTLWHRNLSLTALKALQVLKRVFRQGHLRLNFIADLVANELRAGLHDI